MFRGQRFSKGCYLKPRPPSQSWVPVVEVRRTSVLRRFTLFVRTNIHVSRSDSNKGASQDLRNVDFERQSNQIFVLCGLPLPPTSLVCFVGLSSLTLQGKLQLFLTQGPTLQGAHKATPDLHRKDSTKYTSPSFVFN